MARKGIEIIRATIGEAQLRAFLGRPFPEMVKFVVDIEDEAIALGGELHSDAEELLLEEGSLQRNLWGGNIYPDADEPHRIEYTALINIRPSQDNRSMEVQDDAIRERMGALVKKLIALRQ